MTSIHGRQSLKGLSPVIAAATLILAVTGCQKPVPQAPDTRAADETAIRAAIDEQVKPIAAFDAAKLASFYADDAVVMTPDAPLIRGREDMQKSLEAMMKMKPEFTFTTAKVEVARSGDLAYNWGTGKMAVKDKKGKVTETTFKSPSVWKKQADGSWKMIVDAWIPDPPQKNK